MPFSIPGILGQVDVGSTVKYTPYGLLPRWEAIIMESPYRKTKRHSTRIKIKITKRLRGKPQKYKVGDIIEVMLYEIS